MTTFFPEPQNYRRDLMTNCSCFINGHCLCYQMGSGERCECAFDCECDECDSMQSFLILNGCPCGGDCQCGGHDNECD